MILFMILLVMIAVLVMAAILIIGIGGGLFIMIFADLIACILIIVFIIRWLSKRKKH